MKATLAILGLTVSAMTGPAQAAPFEQVDNLVVVPAAVNGHAGRFVLDSGTSLTILDSRWAMKIGLAKGKAAPAVVGAGARKTALRFTTAHSVAVGALTLHNPTIGIMDMDPLSRSIGFRIGGLLGGDVFAHAVVEIDYPHNRFSIRPADGTGALNCSHPLALTVANGVPIVQAEIIPAQGGVPVAARMMFDMGTRHYAAIVGPPFVIAHRLRQHLLTSRPAVIGSGTGGSVNGLKARIASIQLGDLTIDRPMIGLAIEHGGILNSNYFDGTLGEPLIDGGLFIADYQRGRLCLSLRGARLAQDDLGPSGAALQLSGDFASIMVEAVAAGSPAAEAGLLAGDRVIVADGRRQLPGQINELRTYLRGELRGGHAVVLTVQRNGRQREIEIRPGA